MKLIVAFVAGFVATFLIVLVLFSIDTVSETYVPETGCTIVTVWDNHLFQPDIPTREMYCP